MVRPGFQVFRGNRARRNAQSAARAWVFSSLRDILSDEGNVYRSGRKVSVAGKPRDRAGLGPLLAYRRLGRIPPAETVRHRGRRGEELLRPVVPVSGYGPREPRAAARTLHRVQIYGFVVARPRRKG